MIQKAILLQMDADEIFRGIQESVGGGSGGSNPFLPLALLFIAVALGVLLVFGRRRSSSDATVRLNHQGKLVREVTRQVPIQATELKRLKREAAEQSLCSPLVLMLCPSLASREKDVKQK